MIDYILFADYFANADIESLRNEIRVCHYNPKTLLWHVILRLLSAGEIYGAEMCMKFVRDPLKPDDPLDAGPIVEAIELLGDRPDIVKWLIDHGADPLHRTINSWTSLHVAARLGAVGSISVLINSGVNVDVGTEIDGDKTPLMEAAAAGQVWSVLCLISKGAVIERVETISGKTAQMIAGDLGCHDVVDLIEYIRAKNKSRVQ